jgi:hypothetical protein
MDATNFTSGNGASLDELIADAELLADYAGRAGKLPPDTQIFQAIDQCRNSKDEARLEARALLYQELAKLAIAVAPVSLAKLKKRGSFEGKLRAAVATAVPFLVGFVTLFLTLYLAFQSSELQKADTALREYQQWIDERPREKIFNAWKMFRYEKVLNATKPPLAQLDAYNQMVAEAKRLVDKGAAIQDLLVQSSVTLYLPNFLSKIGPQWFRDFVADLNTGGGPSREEKQAAIDGTGAIDAKDPSRRQLTYKDSYTPARCAEILSAAMTDADPPSPALHTLDFGKYIDTQFCFLTLLKIDVNAVDYSPYLTIYPTKSKVNLLTGWLLPSLYGMLGACVFLMRDFVLMGGIRRLHTDATFLSMLSLVLRVALGGLAGIIIGWFWVPPPITGGSAAMPISSIPFGLSFLAGFSIETLFSLVDRLNHTVSHEAKDPPK